MIYDQDATADLGPYLGALRPPSPKTVEQVSWVTVLVFLIPATVVVFAVSFAVGRYLLT